MKAILYSDLHIEFGKFKPRLDHSTYDFALCAGDIGTGVSGAAWVRENVKNGYYIAGNHEFYGGADLFKHYAKLSTKEKLAEAPGSMTFLQNRVVEGVTDAGEKYRIIGATLWTDFSLPSMFCNNFPNILSQRLAAGQYALNDYRHIMNGLEFISPETILDEHKKSVEFIKNTILYNPFDGKTIVMTHHAPTRYSIIPGFRDSEINFMYASDLEDVIMETQPDLWVHGHTHGSVDYMIGNTRVVTNPRGYVGYGRGPDRCENDNFNTQFIIDL